MVRRSLSPTQFSNMAKLEKILTAVQVVHKIGKSDLGIISETARKALERRRAKEFLDDIKDQLVRDSPIGARTIMGEELRSDVLRVYRLPYATLLDKEQLTVEISNEGLSMVSKSAGAALLALKSEEFMEGILMLHSQHPQKSHEFIGDRITVLLNNFVWNDRKPTKSQMS